MSVYSGFSTRYQESQYNRLIQKLIDLLQYRVKANIKDFRINDHSWGKQFLSIYQQMAEMEVHKYLNPKFSESCKEIVKLYTPQFPKKLNNYPRSFRNFNKPSYSPRKFKKITKIDGNTPAKSEYYDKLMNSFLEKGRMSCSPPKPRRRLDFNHHEFWLIDDKIQVIK
jgi:hypothetical protein